MRTIKAFTSMDEVNKIHYSKTFEIVDGVEVGGFLHGDKIKKIEPVRLDYEQGKDEVYSYNYYRVETEENGEYNPKEDICSVYWVAVEKEEEQTEAEEVAERIYNADEWNPDDCKRLCELAGLAEEWEKADGETFEKVIYKAAYQLGVAI